jgi:hypothetical protein
MYITDNILSTGSLFGLAAGRLGLSSRTAFLLLKMSSVVGKEGLP